MVTFLVSLITIYNKCNLIFFFKFLLLLVFVVFVHLLLVNRNRSIDFENVRAESLRGDTIFQNKLDKKSPQVGAQVNA